MEKKINDFIVFCIKMYVLFEKYGVLKYLHDGYDMLHTQGDRWLMKDINEFLKIRGYNVK